MGEPQLLSSGSGVPWGAVGRSGATFSGLPWTLQPSFSRQPPDKGGLAAAAWVGAEVAAGILASVGRKLLAHLTLYKMN